MDYHISPGHDVDVVGNGRLLMRIIQPGKGTESKPTTGQVVELRVKCLLVDGKDYDGKDYPKFGVRKFRLGDGDECDAFESVAPLVQPGDICAVRSIPAAFNLAQDLCEARPTATTEAVVELVSVQSLPPVLECPLSERRSEAKKKKIRGNWLFGRGEFQAAAHSFRLGVSYIGQLCHEHAVKNWESGDGKDTSSDDGLTEEDLCLCCTLWTNLALVQLKIPDMVKDAVSSCEAALALQPKNVKAMYLRAKTLLSGDHVTQQARNEAIAMLKALLEIAPGNDSAQKLLDEAVAETWSWPQFILVILIVLVFFVGTIGWSFSPVANRPNATLTVPGTGTMRGDEF